MKPNNLHKHFNHGKYLQGQSNGDVRLLEATCKSDTSLLMCERNLTLYCLSAVHSGTDVPMLLVIVVIAGQPY